MIKALLVALALANNPPVVVNEQIQIPSTTLPQVKGTGAAELQIDAPSGQILGLSNNGTDTLTVSNSTVSALGSGGFVSTRTQATPNFSCSGAGTCIIGSAAAQTITLQPGGSNTAVFGTTGNETLTGAYITSSTTTPQIQGTGAAKLQISAPTGQTVTVAVNGVDTLTVSSTTVTASGTGGFVASGTTTPEFSCSGAALCQLQAASGGQSVSINGGLGASGGAGGAANLTSGNPGAAVTTGQASGTAAVQTQNAGAGAAGNNNGGASGQLFISVGVGGAGTGTGTGGAGGGVSITCGAGGASAGATGTAGAGGTCQMFAGGAGAANGGTGAAGGNVDLRVGAGSGAASAGVINIGAFGAVPSGITIGQGTTPQVSIPAGITISSTTAPQVQDTGNGTFVFQSARANAAGNIGIALDNSPSLTAGAIPFELRTGGTGILDVKCAAASACTTTTILAGPATNVANGGNVTYQASAGQAGSGAQNGFNAGNTTLGGAVGGAAGTSGNGGSGDATLLNSGTGGAGSSSTGNGGAGGGLTISGGNGGATGGASGTAGAGGAIILTSGSAGATNGGTGAASGNVSINVGAATGAAANGTIGIGNGSNVPASITVGQTTAIVNIQGNAGKFQLNGNAFDTTFCVYNTGNLAATTAFGETTFNHAVTVDASSKITQDVAGVGAGNFVVKVCTDGTTCAAGNTYLTYTEACTAAAGTRTAAVVGNSGAIAAGSTATINVTTACATTDPAANVCIHYTNP